METEHLNDYPKTPSDQTQNNLPSLPQTTTPSDLAQSNPPSLPQTTTPSDLAQNNPPSLSQTTTPPLNLDLSHNDSPKNPSSDLTQNNPPSLSQTTTPPPDLPLIPSISLRKKKHSEIVNQSGVTILVWGAHGSGKKTMLSFIGRDKDLRDCTFIILPTHDFSNDTKIKESICKTVEDLNQLVPQGVNLSIMVNQGRVSKSAFGMYTLLSTFVLSPRLLVITGCDDCVPEEYIEQNSEVFKELKMTFNAILPSCFKSSQNIKLDTLLEPFRDVSVHRIKKAIIQYVDKEKQKVVYDQSLPPTSPRTNFFDVGSLAVGVCGALLSLPLLDMLYRMIQDCNH